MAMNDSHNGFSEEVFDRAHLFRNTMQNQKLAAEVLGLFLAQLPAMLEALDTAQEPAAWTFATHTLKGASAAIGAPRLYALASDLEALPFPVDLNVRLLRLQVVKAAAAEFRQAVAKLPVEAAAMVVFPAPIS
jgi:HPt (histidine-containing phosphotransfer) domain-containing protein